MWHHNTRGGEGERHLGKGVCPRQPGSSPCPGCLPNQHPPVPNQDPASQLSRHALWGPSQHGLCLSARSLPSLPTECLAVTAFSAHVTEEKTEANVCHRACCSDRFGQKWRVCVGEGMVCVYGMGEWVEGLDLPKFGCPGVMCGNC